jgi:beta-lactamase regulating signal transducer with metallopeptidase domain
MNAWMMIVTRTLQHTGIAAGVADIFFKSFVILLLAGVVSLWWWRQAAAARHLVWFLAVAGMLFLPGFSGLRPVGQHPLWTMGARAGADNELTFTLSLSPTRAGSGVAKSASPAPASVAPVSDGAGQPADGRRWVAHLPATGVALAFGVWLGGAGLLLLAMAVGSLRLRALRRTAHPPTNDDWGRLLHALRGELKIGRRVTLLQSADEMMPATWGWWRPVILLPAAADEWPPERRRVVLLHELAHVKRWDCLTQWVARLAGAVYWFNPLVWVAARRMSVERESACDDLVLRGGCKASDYAGHLLEIARTFRRVPQVAAIAMARSARLEGRIAAIVDATRPRRGPRAGWIALGGLVVLAFLALVTVPASEADSTAPATAGQPWWDARLRAFFVAKEAQARQLAGQDEVAPEVWPYFTAGSQGEWLTATNLWTAMRKRAHQYEGTTPDYTLDKVWAPILETDLAWEQFANWKKEDLLAYGHDIINSIPPGSIYFGGTDPGRGVITAMSESHADGKPFYTITQNALADGTYLDYLRAMYGRTLYIPTTEDAGKSFADYTAEAQKRYEAHQLLPGEDIQMVDGEARVQGQVAVMNINGLLAKIIFDHNRDREFYLEESFPLDWMYPYLSPHGLIMKVNREPLAELSADVVREDHDYWLNYLKPILGDGLNEDGTVADVTAFVEKIYLKHDLDGFTGDPQFIADTWGQKAFSKLRTSIAGIYAWRATNAKTPAEKQRMTQAADFAFRQAYALCPGSPEALYRYVNLLVGSNRVTDALLLAETSLKIEPDNRQTQGLVDQLKKMKAKHSAPAN